MKPSLDSVAPILALLLCGCGDPQARATPAWAKTIADVDPVFAGPSALQQHWAIHCTLPGVKECENIKTELPRLAAELGGDALRRVEKLIDGELGAGVAEFLRSAAGKSLAAAEGSMLTMYPTSMADLETTVLDVLCDPAKVGDAARSQVMALRNQVANKASASMSPLLVAQLVAAMGMSKASAASARDFYNTAVGKRWMKARFEAFEAGKAARDQLAASLNVGTSPWSNFDLYLPRER
ncbi:MAG: hypothetical protein AB8H80_19685 [Planctomycetota bacterium]